MYCARDDRIAANFADVVLDGVVRPFVVCGPRGTHNGRPAGVRDINSLGDFGGTEVVDSVLLLVAEVAARRKNSRTLGAKGMRFHQGHLTGYDGTLAVTGR